jgi:hypothetical protein
MQEESRHCWFEGDSIFWYLKPPLLLIDCFVCHQFIETREQEMNIDVSSLDSKGGKLHSNAKEQSV